MPNFEALCLEFIVMVDIKKIFISIIDDHERIRTLDVQGFIS